MRTIYVDSGAFIALVRRKDRQHPRIRQHFEGLLAEGSRLITSDPAVAETATRLRYDVGLEAALAFRRALTSASGRLTIRDSDAKLRAAAFDFMAHYADLRLSYADAMGAAVAREAKASAVFGLDDDFRVLGFSLEP